MSAASTPSFPLATAPPPRSAHTALAVRPCCATVPITMTSPAKGFTANVGDTITLVWTVNVEEATLTSVNHTL